MPVLHFMNVGQGDCIWLKHTDGKNTVIDVSNARTEPALSLLGNYFSSGAGALGGNFLSALASISGTSSNFRQKDNPINPIDYMRSFGESSVFRFVLTHPDMDHMDGLKPFFEAFDPVNFWDTNNEKTMGSFAGSRYDERDWRFYRGLRDGNRQGGPKRLTLLSGARGPFYNRAEDGTGGGNGLYILSPTQGLVDAANECGDYNDCSYVLLWLVNGKKIVIGGDSHDVSWEHILREHAADVKNVDLLIAPHHGRSSSRAYDFLDVLKPKLTFFGVARREHLAYSSWTYRDLEVISNNQGGSLVVNLDDQAPAVYCTHEPFAQAYRREKYGDSSFHHPAMKAWYLRAIL